MNQQKKSLTRMCLGAGLGFSVGAAAALTGTSTVLSLRNASHDAEALAAFMTACITLAFGRLSVAIVADMLPKSAKAPVSVPVAAEEKPGVPIS